MPRRTVPRWAHLAATALAGVLALGLTGCSGDSKPTQAPTLEVTSSEPTTDPVEAIADASAAIKSLRQTMVDIYASSGAELDDLDRYATGAYLDAEKQAIAAGLEEGWTSNGGRIDLRWVREVDADLERRDPRMTLHVCVDSSKVKSTGPSGEVVEGGPQDFDFSVRAVDSPNGGQSWKVDGLTTHDGAEEPGSC